MKLAERIFDSLSDGYDDEEHRETTITELHNSLSQLHEDDPIKQALWSLCDRIEELEFRR